MSNKEKLYTLALGILLSVGMIGFGMFLGYQFADGSKAIDHFPDGTKMVDTIVMHDTIRFASEVNFTHKTDKTIETRFVEIHDTIVRNDTLFVELPFTQKHYHEDSVCDIWISGYEPNLDSANIIQRERTIIERHFVTTKQNMNIIAIEAGTRDASVLYLHSFGKIQVGFSAGTTYEGTATAKGIVGFRF